MNDQPIDESPIGIYLWFVLIGVNVAMVVGFDVWLHRNGHEFLTTEFREGLQHPVWGVVLAACTAALFAAWLWHFFIQHN